MVHTESHVRCRHPSPGNRSSVAEPYSVRPATSVPSHVCSVALADSHSEVRSCPLPCDQSWADAFLFFENIFWGNPSSTTPHHTPMGRTYVSLRESNLLLLVKPQDVDHHPHIKLYVVFWHGWVGLVTTWKLLWGILE